MFELKIDTRNDAFGAVPEKEVARILHKLADDLVSGRFDPALRRNEQVLMDMNGNKVGTAKLSF